MTLDLGAPLRASLLDQQDPDLQALASEITGLLDEWEGDPAVFAFRPLPAGAPDLLIVVNEDAAISDADGLNSSRPIIERDVICYGRKGSPGESDDQSDTVERIGYLMRELWHRQKFSVQPVGYSVTEITVRGPVAAPADDDGTIGRMVNLTIRLRRNSA